MIWEITEETFDVVLVPEDQLEVVVPFVGFIATHVEVRSPAPINCTKAFVDSVVEDSGGYLQPAAFVEGRHTSSSRAELQKPVFIDFLNILLQDLSGFGPLFLFEPGFATSAFCPRGIHMAEHLSH